MLEHADISGHQRRRGEPKHLPERKIPGHDGEHDTERLKRHPRLAPAIWTGSSARKRSRIFGVIAAARRALLGLRDRCLERLPHLEGHQPSQLTAFRFENVRRFSHACCAIRERSQPMLAISSCRAIEGFVHSRRGIRLECEQYVMYIASLSTFQFLVLLRPWPTTASSPS